MIDKDIFKNPPAKYRPVPFWFWNGKLEAARLEQQIRDFYEKGIGGFFIHARFGLETGYLSDEWFDLIRKSVEIAAALGMEVWIYDENGFPSGIGDLKVSRVREYRPKFVEAAEFSGRGPHNISDGEALGAIARDRKSGRIMDISDRLRDGQLEWNEDSEVTIFIKRTLEDPNDVVYGIDYLNPEATRAFFELVLEPYARTVGEHFGKTIKGIFTDEPTLLPWHHNINWYDRLEHTRVVVWNDLIAGEMLKRHGLTPIDWLPHLFCNVDETSPMRRIWFWTVVSDLYVDSYFKPYREWCDRHGLKLTGHVLFEEGLYLNTDFQSDITRVLQYLHIPGTDHLGASTETEYGGWNNTPRVLTNVQGHKLVSSIGRLIGSEAVLAETYGCADWGLSPQQMKIIADWQYSLGINMLCPHALFYSIEGFRKSDAPPSHNHMSTWKHYRRLADYCARLSYVLRQGTPISRIAVLYPLSSFWAVHTVGTDNIEQRTISDSFDLICSILTASQIDYDILPEHHLARAEIKEGMLVLGGCSYHVLIIPPSPFAPAEIAGVIEKFVRSGGLVIAHVPEHLPPGPLDEMIECLPRKHALKVPACKTSLATLLTDAISTRHVNPVRVTGPGASAIRATARDLGDTNVYFLANSSAEYCDVEIWLGCVGAAEVWNLETGDVCPFPASTAAGGLQFQYRFPPCGSLLVKVDKSRRPVEVHSISVSSRVLVVDLPEEWEFDIVEDNVLILDKWRLEIRTDGAGSTYRYITTVQSDFEPGEIALLLDDIEYRSSLMGGMDLKVTVNGELQDAPEPWGRLDPAFKVVHIGRAMRRGQNDIEITIRHEAWSGQPHLLTSLPRLIGHFSLRDPRYPSLSPPGKKIGKGSWTQFGYPYFSGTGIYRTRFILPENINWENVILKIEQLADMMEVEVNGQGAVVRPWPPWEADITHWVRPGENNLVLKITNSMQNFIEGVQRPSGLLGSASVEVFCSC